MAEEADDTLISIRPKSDFERLLFAEDQVKALKRELSAKNIELGKTSSEKQELEHKLSTVQEDIINQISDAEKKNLMLKLHKYKEKEKKRDIRVSDLRKTIEQLVVRCAKLQKTPEFWESLQSAWQKLDKSEMVDTDVFNWFKKQLT